MMNVTLLTVGKLKERYLTDGCREYQKRLGAYCKLDLVELPEYRLPDRPSESEIQTGLLKEGETILQRIPSGAIVIPLCIEGKEMSSEEFSSRLGELALAGNSSICFIIGGSYGLSEAVKSQARFALSLSPMTFPHQLARLLFLEQLYRAFSILNHAKYHK